MREQSAGKKKFNMLSSGTSTVFGCDVGVPWFFFISTTSLVKKYINNALILKIWVVIYY